MNSQPIGRTPIGHLSTAGPSQPKPAPDPVFSGLARLACGACGASFASIAVIGYRDAWFTATAEVPDHTLPRQDPFTRHAAQADGLFEVSDTAADERFRESEAVTGALGIRSYAGCVLRTSTGEALGTLAVYGTAPRSLSAEQRRSMLLLAEQAVAGIELRSRLSEFVLLAAAPALPVPPSDAAAARALLDSAPVAIYHTDAAGNMSYSNPEYRRIFGLKPDQSMDTWAQRVHPDDRERMEQAWTEFCRQRIPSRFDLPHAHRRRCDTSFLGASRRRERCARLGGNHHRLYRLGRSTRRFTPRRNPVSQHLRPSAARHRVCRSQRQILAVQSCLLRHAGFRPGGLRRQDACRFTCAEDATRVTRELERLWSGEIQFVDLEKRYLCKDGKIIWVRTTTALVRESEATPEYSVEFLRDITARKEAAEELERVHKQLMTASRQAGMAEVATNVCTTSATFSTASTSRPAWSSSGSSNPRPPALPASQRCCTEKGAGVARLHRATTSAANACRNIWRRSASSSTSDQKMALEELASLRDNLEHIKDTVAMQQSYAKLCGVTETIEVAELVEDSLRMNAGAFVRHGVTLQRDFAEVPPITVDKHKVLQILVNLVRNAKYACDESGRPDKLHHAAHRGGAGWRADQRHRQWRRHRRGKHGAPVHPRLHHAQRPATASACTAVRSPRRNSAARCVSTATAPAAAPRSRSSCPVSPTETDRVYAPAPLANRRILIIDDNAAIHQDFRKVLGAQAEHSAQAALDVLEANLFGDAASRDAPELRDRLRASRPGRRGDGARRRCAEGRPYCHGLRRHAHAARLGRPARPSSGCGPRIPTSRS